MKKVVVISLGGSLIAPDNVDVKLLENFKEVIKKNIDYYKFVVVCGGGSIARKYISALRKEKISAKLQSMAGIAVTRLNARFLGYFFNRDSKEGVPHDIRHVEGLLRKNDVVFCGALRYKPENTSDGTAASLASHFNCDFINLTNVQGLYSKNPLEHKDARFIPSISKIVLYERVMKMKFKPGQHFVIDQAAMKILKNKKITLYILGPDMHQLDNLLNGKKFIGTVVN